MRALLPALLLAAACHGDGRTTTPTPTTPPANATPAPAPRAPDYSATLADPFAFLPLDSELVMGVDAAAVRQSALWPLAASAIDRKFHSVLAEFTTKCGFDPVQDLRSMTMGIKHLDGQPEGVAVIRGYDRDKTRACLDTNQKSVVAIDGDIVQVRGTAGNTMAFTYLDRTTSVVVMGPNADAKALRAVLHAGVPLHGSPAFNDLAAHTRVDSALWVIANGQGSLFDKLAATGIRPKAFFGSLFLTSGIGFTAHVRLDSPAAAQQLRQLADQNVAAARAFVDKLEITDEDADVVVDIQMTDDQLTNMLKLAGVQVP